MSMTEQPAAASRAIAQPDRTTYPLVYKNMTVLVAVVICCFTHGNRRGHDRVAAFGPIASYSREDVRSNASLS
jgi:hypothetical protein